jgi:hypothetical protein
VTITGGQLTSRLMERRRRVRLARIGGGGSTPDQVWDVLVLCHLEEDLLRGEDAWHRFYGLVRS